MKSVLHDKELNCFRAFVIHADQTRVASTKQLQ